MFFSLHSWLIEEIRDTAGAKNSLYTTVWTSEQSSFQVSIQKQDELYITTLRQVLNPLGEGKEILKVMSKFPKIIMDVNTRQEVFQIVCDIFVKTGGFASCWIGVIDSSSGYIVSVASQGNVDDSLGLYSFNIYDEEKKDEPICVAVREKRSAISLNDGDSNDNTSTLAVPLYIDKVLTGVIVINSRQDKSFSREFVKLVERISEYIGYTVEFIQNKESIKQGDKNFEEVLRSSPVGIIVVRSSKIIYVNPKLLEIYGYTEENELLGKNIAIIQPPELHDVLLELGMKRELGLPAPNRYRSIGLKKDDTRFPIIINVDRVIFQGKWSTLAFIEDLSDIKKYESQLREAEIKIFQGNKMEALGQLAGGISHDVNNILTSISGAAELMKLQIEEDSELVPLVDQIISSCKYGSSLATQLLTFARKSTVELKPVDLVPVVKGVLKIVKRTVDRRIKILEKIDVKKGVVLGNEDRLFNAILNLCLNSRDAIDGNGEIRVRVSRQSTEQINYILVQVSDTGVGMPVEIRHKVFEPFFSTKKKGKGTGLGLSMVFGVVHDYGGKVWFDTELGEGTTFTILLPEFIDQIFIESPEEESKPDIFQSLRLLVIDDDNNVLKVLQKFLELDGHQVTSYTDGSSAIEDFKVNSRTYDLILLDINMPLISGWDILDELKVIRPNVKVLLITGNLIVDGDMYDKFKDCIVGILKKPFSRKELKETILGIQDELI